MAEYTKLPKLVMGYVHVIEPDGKEYTPADDAIIHFEGDDDSDIRVQCPDAPAFAALIVKAVNSHEELVEALKEAVHRLEGVWDDVGYQFDGDFTAPEDGLIARLHKVLSVATEPRP